MRLRCRSGPMRNQRQSRAIQQDVGRMYVDSGAGSADHLVGPGKALRGGSMIRDYLREEVMGVPDLPHSEHR